MITPEAKKMLEDAGYGKGEISLDPAKLPDRFKSAAHPPLPTVGRIVHFYQRYLVYSGPFAAIVHQVIVENKADDSIQAAVILKISATGELASYWGDSHAQWIALSDVPGVQAGVKHDYKYWWQWPERS